MATAKLTVNFIKGIPTPATGQEFYYDESLPCFGLIAFASGKKSYGIRYRNKFNKRRWLTIGAANLITLDQARKKARELLQQVELGHDPAQDKIRDKEAINVAQLCDWYIRDGCTHKKQSTINSDHGRIETLIKPLIGSEPVASLTQGQVIGFMNDIINGTKVYKREKSGKARGISHVRGGEGAANRTLQTLGAIMHFAKKQGLITINPVSDIDRPKTKKREVFLTINEIRLLGQALNSPEWNTLHKNQCDLIKLILMTGCRKSEITTLKWDYIDFDNQVFHFPDTKTGKQDRPFGVGALHLLQEIKQNNTSEWVFPSSRGDGHLENLLRLFKRICATNDNQESPNPLNKPGINLHALRHTFASLAADMGYSDITIAALLGHRLGTITSRYTHTVDKSIIAAADDVSSAIENALQPHNQTEPHNA